jgi:signal transduction histidine kinase
MSLKTRLRILIVTLVTSLVLMQCVASLRFLADSNITGSSLLAENIADQAVNLVKDRVNVKQRSEPTPATPEETKQLWWRLVEDDPTLPALLLQTMGFSTAIVEILVCDENGRILTSGETNKRETFLQLPLFTTWTELDSWKKLLDVLTQSRDFVIVREMAIGAGSTPVMTIRVIVSTTLIREAILPQIRDLAVVSGLSLLLSVIVAILFSNVVFKSLDRLSKRIESIALGKPVPEDSAPEAKEIADMQSKLDALGQQFRGAKEDVQKLRTNVERMLEGLEESVLLFGPDFRLLQASRSAEKLLAQSRVQMAGMTLQDLFPSHTPMGALLDGAVLRREGLHEVTETMNSGDTPVRVLVSMELLEDFPTPGLHGYLLTLRDAETRRQIRSQLDVSARLAAISKLTGGVAHEIKNPLNAMALHLEILKSKLSGDDTVKNEVAVIGGEIARLDRVVKTFLDFQRPVELRLKELNLVELARQVAALVWPQAERSHVSIELEAPAGMAPIAGDEDLLKQAFLNVVNNGIEAMKDGGRLQIRIERDGDEVVGSISDQGSGIPDELKEKIFNLYFSTKQKGSGIGLAMTYRIVQLHNATIDVVSAPGEGTTFFLRFPIADGAA